MAKSTGRSAGHAPARGRNGHGSRGSARGAFHAAPDELRRKLVDELAQRLA